MLKEKDIKDNILDDFVGAPENSRLTYEGMAERLHFYAREGNFPIEISMEEVKVRNGLTTSSSSFMLIRNAKHPDDYYGILVTLNTSGARPVVNAYLCGESKHMGYLEKNDKAKKGRASRKEVTNNFLGGVNGLLLRAPATIASYAMSGARSLMCNKDAIEDEQLHQEAVLTMIKIAAQLTDEQFEYLKAARGV